MEQDRLITCINCNRIMGCLNFSHRYITLCSDCALIEVYSCSNTRNKDKMEKLSMECVFCKVKAKLRGRNL